MKTISDIATHHDLNKFDAIMRNMIQSCADAGKAKAQANAISGNIEPLHLFYKPSTKTANGQLLLVTDSEPNPVGFELATGEGLRGDVPYDNYYCWVQTRSTRLPVLAWA